MKTCILYNTLNVALVHTRFPFASLSVPFSINSLSIQSRGHHNNGALHRFWLVFHQVVERCSLRAYTDSSYDELSSLGRRTPSIPQDGGEDDIAVIGMACRLPGNNDSPEKLWQSILDKKVASGPLPKIRWQAYPQRHPHNTKVRTLEFDTEVLRTMLSRLDRS